MLTSVVEARVSDESLMLSYRGGDTTAFETLYNRFRAPLYRYFLRQTYDKALCEELFQEVWLSLIRNRHSYSPDAKFSTYLYRIAHSRLVDHFRRKSNGRYHDLFPLEQLPADSQSQPEHVIELEQREKRLLSATQELPQEQREVFMLRAESGLKLEEIAAVLDVPFETAKSRLRYAIKKLARCLRDEKGETNYKLTGTL
jgi:RNA polymerase sigma-70 factor (ECF subfamily)